MGSRRGRPTVAVVLDDEERETLERWARRPKSSQALALRCRIVLAAAEGRANNEVAAALGCHAATVSKWRRRRFAERRLDGLADDPRPGPPRKITDAVVEEVLVRTVESAPRDATHWSTRSMAKEVGVSQTAVSQIWRAFGLKPHLAEEFKVSPDPQFIEKVRDVVELYLNPPEAAAVHLWPVDVHPTSRADDAWKWEAAVLTDEGWTRDGDGTTADHLAACEAAHQHVADRLAAEPSQPDKQAERRSQVDATNKA